MADGLTLPYSAATGSAEDAFSVSNSQGNGIAGNSSFPTGSGVVGTSTQWDGVTGISHASAHAGVSAANDAGGIGVWAKAATAGHFEGNAHINGTLDVTQDVLWGKGKLTPDQGGSIELGGTNGNAGSGTPYIDFHYVGLTEDYNIRLINDTDAQLTIDGKDSKAPCTLQVKGDVRANDVFLSCDLRFKSNLKPIREPLTKLRCVRGVTFKRSEDRETAGVIAQDLQAAMPELVKEHGVNSSKAVNLGGLVALLVEVCKELDVQNSHLRQRLARLETSLASR